MTTLAVMKARIASDLRRDDLTSDIADYIPDAIADFQQKRLFFNETRAFAFNTESAKQRYTEVEFPNVANIIKIDSAYVTIGGSKFRLWPRQPVLIEQATTNANSSGQSTHYAFYDRSLWLYPIPNDIWAVNLLAVAKAAAPASDGETNNPWMTDCARLIRSQTIGHLYAYIIKDKDKASSFYTLAQDALTRLEDKTADMTKTGDYLVEEWDPY